MTSLREALAKKLSKKELGVLRTSFDIIGDIAVIEVPDELVKKQKIIATALLTVHKNVKVVAKKKGGHTGKYRLQKVIILSGARRKTTEHKESGVRLRLNVETAYFSPRVSNERLRISRLVKTGENVLVMFSGVGPYPLVIARNANPKSVVGVEMNPAAHKFAAENVILNKLSDVVAVHKGDVRKVVPKLKKKFDRVIMPLPKTGESFLDVAISAIKKGGTLHFYDFLPEEAFDEAKNKIRSACKMAKRKCRFLRIVKVGQQKPRVWRICADFKIN